MIKHKCCCGAEVEIDDSNQLLMTVMSDEWLDRHTRCFPAMIKRHGGLLDEFDPWPVDGPSIMQAAADYVANHMTDDESDAPTRAPENKTIGNW